MAKLSKIDTEILGMIAKKPEGMYNLEIAKQLRKYPEQTHRRLQRLTRLGILDRLNSGLVYYKLKIKNNPALELYVIVCPKCKTEHIIHYEQSSKTCENKSCLSKSGNRTRFYISDKRVIGIKRIVK